MWLLRLFGINDWYVVETACPVCGCEGKARERKFAAPTTDLRLVRR